MQNTTRNKMHSIYAIICPETLQVRYVGCTSSSDVRKRVINLSNEEREVSKWIKSIDKKPVISILEKVMDGKTAAHKKEMYWIKRFLDEGQPLFNIHGNHLNAPTVARLPVLDLCGKLNGSKSIKKLLEETKNKVA